MGRILLVFGILLAVIGGGLMLFGRFHLPGDLTLRAGGATIYIPIATSIILSVVVTVVLNLLFRPIIIAGSSHLLGQLEKEEMNRHELPPGLPTAGLSGAGTRTSALAR